MKLKNNINKQAFTLVELIVVVVILSILGTIAFLAFSQYPAYARNVKRASDLKNITTALVLYQNQTGKFPEISSGDGFTVTFSGANVWTQGAFSEKIKTNIGRISELPVDPLTFNEYDYSVTANGGEYQLGAIQEITDFGFTLNTSGISAKVLAADKVAKAFIEGNYNGEIIHVNTGATDYVLAVPSLLTSNINGFTATLQDVIDSASFVIDGETNVPPSYASNGYATGAISIPGLENNGYIAFSGSTTSLSTPSAQADLHTALSNAYTGSLLASQDPYNELYTVVEADQGNLINNLIINNPSIYVPGLNESNIVAISHSNGNHQGGGNNGNGNGNGGSDSGGNVTQWRDDPSNNCDVDDHTVGSITWAGCNSIQGGGTNYPGNTDTSKNGEDMLYGRLYLDTEKSGACPTEWRLPTPDEISGLIPGLGSNVGSKIIASTSSEVLGEDVHLKLPKPGLNVPAFGGYINKDIFSLYYTDSATQTLGKYVQGNQTYEIVNTTQYGAGVRGSVRCVKNAVSKINGECNSDINSQNVYVIPENPCSAGTVNNLIDNGKGNTITWQCNGVNGGNQAFCSSNHILNPLSNLFASGSVFTENWDTNSCDTNNLDYIEFNSGATLPTTLKENSIYKLHTGNYIISSTITTPNNNSCIGIVGEANVNIYSSSNLTLFSQGTSSNNIITGLTLDGTSDGIGGSHIPNYCLWAKNITNSTIHGLSFNNCDGSINLESSNKNTIKNISINGGRGITLGGITLNLGSESNIIKNIKILNNSTYSGPSGFLIQNNSHNNLIENIRIYESPHVNNGLRFFNSNGNIVNNAHIYNAGGFRITSSSNNTINNSIANNNVGDGFASSHGSFNNLLNNFISYSNGGVGPFTSGLYLFTGNDTILHNVQSYNHFVSGAGPGTNHSNKGIYGSGGTYYGNLKIFFNLNSYGDANSITGIVTPGISNGLGNVGFAAGNLDNSGTFDINYTINPNAAGWSGTLNGRQSISFNGEETYTFGSNLPNQSRPIKYNSNTSSFEYYGANGIEYNTSKKIGDF